MEKGSEISEDEFHRAQEEIQENNRITIIKDVDEVFKSKERRDYGKIK